MFEPDPQEFGAEHLIATFVDLRCPTRDLGNWTEEEFSTNPPRLTRLQRLQAMFRAFELDVDFSGFKEGQFIRDDRAYGALVELLGEVPRVNFGWDGVATGTREPHTGERAGEMTWQFRYLLSARQAAADYLVTLSCSEISGVGLGAGISELKMEGRELIEGHVPKLDRVLGLFVDPESRSYSRRVWIEWFGYPSDSLFSMDAEWA